MDGKTGKQQKEKKERIERRREKQTEGNRDGRFASKATCLGSADPAMLHAYIGVH